MCSWTLDCFTWIQNGCLARLMANHGCVPCYGARVGCSLCGGVLVKLGCFAEALAFEEIGVILQAAAARAATYFLLVALSCLATSVAQAFEFGFWVHSWQAAAAPAAAFFEGYPCKYFLGHMFESCWIFAGILLLGLWKFTEVNSSTIGMGKTQKSEELKGLRDFSILQASIQEEASG